MAFGEVIVPQNIAAGDFHLYLTSKIQRVTYWLELTSTLERLPIFCLVTSPAEHLLMVLQMRDAAGSMLRDLHFPGKLNPFSECLMQYFSMLEDPKQNLKTLIKLYARRDFDTVWSIMQVVLSISIGIMACIWRDLFMFYESVPFSNVRLASPDADAALEHCRSLYDAPDCCTDDAFTKKVIATERNPEALALSPKPRCAVELYSRHKRITNMATERLLKGVRTASHGKCFFGRMVGAGYLNEIQSVHRKAGGADVTKHTRARMAKLGVPLKVLGKKIKRVEMSA